MKSSLKSLLNFSVTMNRVLSTEAAGRPVKHVVMFSFKEGTTKQDISNIKSKLLDLPKQIPVIRSYELGSDLELAAGQNHPAGKNRVVLWSACFDSVQEYQIYDEHEAHKDFLSHLKEVVLPGSRSAIQYELNEYSSE